MSTFLYFVNTIINFLGWLQQLYNNFYRDLKNKTFDNKLIYYAVYDINTKRYTLIHNFNNFLSTLYCYLINYNGITYDDLEFIIHDRNIIIITSYILNNKEYHDILNYDIYYSLRKPIHNKIIYAYTENNKDNLTHEYELFKNSIFKLQIPAQDIYNIIMGYKNRTFEKITNIKIMIDDKFEEKTYI